MYVILYLLLGTTLVLGAPQGYKYPPPAGPQLTVGGNTVGAAGSAPAAGGTASTGLSASGGLSSAGLSTGAGLPSAEISTGVGLSSAGLSTGAGSSANKGGAGSVAAASSAAASSAATGASSGKVIEIVADERQGPDGTGAYSFSYETQDGVVRSEKGTVGTAGTIAQQGEITYTLPDGQPFTLTFVADENGYQPQSPLLPPIPDFVLQQIEFAKNNPLPEVESSGKKVTAAGGASAGTASTSLSSAAAASGGLSTAGAASSGLGATLGAAAGAPAPAAPAAPSQLYASPGRK